MKKRLWLSAAFVVAAGASDARQINSSDVVPLITGQTLTAPVITGGSISGTPITGGTLNGTPIGGTTPAAGAFTTITGNASGATTTATGATAARALADRQAERLNVRDFGAKGDTIGLLDGIISSGSNALSSASATFTAADVGKRISVDGAGAGGAPLSTTITGYTSAHAVTLATNAGTTTGPSYATLAVIATPQAGAGSYAAGDTITLAGGTAITPTVITVVSTIVQSATVNNAGSGGNNGSCILTGTTGTSVNGPGYFRVNATITGGSIASLGSFVDQSAYSVNPTSLAAEPVTSSCGGLTGATLTLTMGVNYRNITVSTPGLYSALPSNPVAQASTSGTGTGATFSMSWKATGAFDYGTDDSAAFTAAINAAVSGMSGNSRQPKCVYLPGGTYMLSASLPTFASVPGCVLGDGPMKSIVHLDTSYSGDVFSWSEAWMGNSYTFNGPSVVLSKHTAGPKAVGFSIIGNRNAPPKQNALVFYDRNDFALVEDVEVHFLNGRGFYVGALKNSTQAFMRESHVNRLRMFRTGSAGYPNVDLSSQGGGDSTNEINFDQVDLYAPYSSGLVARSGVNGSRFSNLRIEGQEWNPAGVSADLLVVGDTTLTGGASSLRFSGLQLLSSYANYAAMRLTAQSSASQPYFISAEGSIGGGQPAGKGLVIDYGRNNNFTFDNVGAQGIGITLGPSAGGANFINGRGLENTWTWAVDPAAINSVLSWGIRVGNPVVQSQLGFELNVHDGSSTGGNAIGNGAIDLQSFRNSPSQVASGPQSVLLGGAYNTVTASTGTIIGGSTNVASAVGGTIVGATLATDRGRQNAHVYAGGSVIAFTPGGSQASRQIMYGSTSTASGARLTSANAGPSNSSTTASCMNIPDKTAYNIRAYLTAIDRTTPANSYAWTLPMALMTRGTGIATTAITLGTPTTLSTGTGSGAGVTATADTTYGCLNITFTPPAGNTDTWDAVVDVWSVEIQ